MADSSKFLHSWSLSRQNLLIRLYVYMIGEDALQTINFCKLFWATLFSPVILAFLGCVWCGDRLAPVRNYFKSKRALKSKRIVVKKAKKPRSGAKKLLRLIGSFFDHIGAFIQHNGKYIIALIIGCALTGLGFLVDYSIYHTHDILHALIALAIVLAIAVAVLGVGIGLAYIEMEYKALTKFGHLLGRVVGRHIAQVFIGLGHGIRATYRFLGTGFYALKYRTCPLVVIEEKR